MKIVLSLFGLCRVCRWSRVMMSIFPILKWVQIDLSVYGISSDHVVRHDPCGRKQCVENCEPHCSPELSCDKGTEIELISGKSVAYKNCAVEIQYFGI